MSRSFKNFIVVFLALFVFVMFMPTLSRVIPDFEDDSTTEAPETTKAPEKAEVSESEDPKETTAVPETTTEDASETVDIGIYIPEADTDWYVAVNTFVLFSYNDIVNIQNVSTDSINGNIMRNGETTYPSGTAISVSFPSGWVAFNGAEISGMNVKVYDQGGNQLGSSVSIVLTDADETIVNAVAALGYSADTVARRIIFENNEVIGLLGLADAGQTVTVVYEITLAGSDDTVEVISIDVTIPEYDKETTAALEAPEDTTVVSEATEYPEETTATPEVTEDLEETTVVPEETTEQIS
ncbi:MAG: OadG family protein [Clostridia bacterium]|nr:OadG family protein [Clostridia bacterium]